MEAWQIKDLLDEMREELSDYIHSEGYETLIHEVERAKEAIDKLNELAELGKGILEIDKFIAEIKHMKE